MLNLKHLKYMDTKSLLKGLAELTKRFNPYKPNPKSATTMIIMMDEILKRVEQGDEELLTDEAKKILDEAYIKLALLDLVEFKIPMIENGIIEYTDEEVDEEWEEEE